MESFFHVSLAFEDKDEAEGVGVTGLEIFKALLGMFGAADFEGTVFPALNKIEVVG